MSNSNNTDITRRYFHGGYVDLSATSALNMERWYDNKRRLHRPNGLPAVVGRDGYESYWEHGEHVGYGKVSYGR